MVWQHLAHQRPKGGAMVKLAQVAQLVDHDVIQNLGRQKDKLVIKVEVALERAAPPPTFGVFDKHAAYRVAVVRVKKRQTRMDSHARLLFVLYVLLVVAPTQH